MTDSVILQILFNVQTSLALILRANGYHNDVQPSSIVLDPLPLDTLSPGQCPFIVVDEDPGNGQNDYGPATSRPTQIKTDFTIQLRCRVEAAGDDPGIKKITAWNFYADVEKALAADRQRGGMALFTYIQFPSFYYGVPGQTQVYAEIPVRILMNRLYGVA